MVRVAHISPSWCSKLVRDARRLIRSTAEICFDQATTYQLCIQRQGQKSNAEAHTRHSHCATLFGLQPLSIDSVIALSSYWLVEAFKTMGPPAYFYQKYAAHFPKQSRELEASVMI